MSISGDQARPKRRPYFWELDYSKGTPEGKDLAALRRGLGRQPGEVPAMWPHYTHLRPDGRVSRELRAEHVALTLFAIHQQSQPALMHQPTVGLGVAMAELRRKGKFSTDAVDRRFSAAATATSFTEVATHLRGLVAQLRAVKPVQPLDYTLLVRDLCDWQEQERVHAVRRRWGAQYFTYHDETEAAVTAVASGKA